MAFRLLPLLGRGRPVAWLPEPGLSFPPTHTPRVRALIWAAVHENSPATMLSPQLIHSLCLLCSFPNKLKAVAWCCLITLNLSQFLLFFPPKGSGRGKDSGPVIV